MKNGVNWGNGFAIGDTDAKNCPLKFLIFEFNEENFTIVSFKTDDSMEANVFNNFFFKVRFYLLFYKGHLITNQCERLTFFSSPVFKKPGIFICTYTFIFRA